MPTAFGGGQSLEDKLSALKFLIAGQEISLAVLKATTSELMGPKRKHLNYLIRLTNEPNVSIPNLVRHLMRRISANSEWTVTFKVLITAHHLASYGNEGFIQNLASSAEYKRNFDQLASFNDCSSTLAFDMSTFVRRHSRYLRTKIHTYRALGTDFCRADHQQTSPRRLLRLGPEKLLTTTSHLQDQLDALLAFDPLARDLNNGIINSAFALLYRDFVKLYIAYQTAIIRLLELYFASNQVRRTRQLLEAYRKFLVRMDKTCDFVRVLDAVGMDRSDLPAFSRAPSLPLRQLEAHLTNLEAAANRRAIYQASGCIQSVEMPRIEYATIGRRRCSLRTPTASPAHTATLAESLVSPVALAGRRRLADAVDELEELQTNCANNETIPTKATTTTIRHTSDNKRPEGSGETNTTAKECDKLADFDPFQRRTTPMEEKRSTDQLNFSHSLALSELANSANRQTAPLPTSQLESLDAGNLEDSDQNFLLWFDANQSPTSTKLMTTNAALKAATSSTAKEKSTTTTTNAATSTAQKPLSWAMELMKPVNYLD